LLFTQDVHIGFGLFHSNAIKLLLCRIRIEVEEKPVEIRLDAHRASNRPAPVERTQRELPVLRHGSVRDEEIPAYFEQNGIAV
jgi:hypothetical protein